MSFDLSTVGYTTKAFPLAFDWRTLATYALGIGARKDELSFLYEHAPGGMKVHPTFAVVPAHQPIVDMLGKCNANMAMVVHGGQVIRLHRAIPDGGTLLTTGTIKGIYDMKKLGQVVLETHTTLSGSGEAALRHHLVHPGARRRRLRRAPPAPRARGAERPQGPRARLDRGGDHEPGAGAPLPHLGRHQPPPRRPRVRDRRGLPPGPHPARAVHLRVRGPRHPPPRRRGRSGPGARLRRPVPQAGVAGRHAGHAGVEPPRRQGRRGRHRPGRPDPVLTNAWAEIA